MIVNLYVSITYLPKRKQVLGTEFPLVLYTAPVLQILDFSSKTFIPSI
jgi:hypothetical protein